MRHEQTTVHLILVATLSRPRRLGFFVTTLREVHIEKRIQTETILFDIRHDMLKHLIITSLLLTPGARAFAPWMGDVPSGRNHVRPRTHPRLVLVSTTETATQSPDIIDTSTMTLFEHVNLNVPSHEYILPFYFEILGLGMDPRKVANLCPSQTGKATLWANCGASQFHFPYGDEAQTIPGHIGLHYPDEKILQELEQRLIANPAAYERYEKLSDARTGKDYLSIVDKYGNHLSCRVGTSRVEPTWQQPIIGTTEQDVATYGEDVVKRFGRSQPACSGLAYVEFQCPTGTAEKIALFYDSVFDATTSVIPDPAGPVAVIGFGKISSQGLADQSLLFRETSDPIPPYDGHHVAMYVGESAADFEQAYQNASLTWCPDTVFTYNVGPKSST